MPADTTSEEDRDAAARLPGTYRDYLAEREEILRHKWVLSEAAGRDVGFEAALLDWVQRHRAAWRRVRNRRGRE